MSRHSPAAVAPAPFDLDEPQAALEQLDAALELLAEAGDTPREARSVAEALAGSLLDLGREQWPDVDPVLFAELMRTAGTVERTLRTTSGEQQAAELELELEAMREVLAELASGYAIDERRPVMEVAAWLKDALGATNAELQALLGPSTRTWERWFAGRGEPQPDDAARIRVAAKVVDQLRYAVTPRGALRWFERPHPGLGGTPPRELLRDPLEASRLFTLAAQMRRSDAS